jgi:hypothetical protein
MYSICKGIMYVCEDVRMGVCGDVCICVGMYVGMCVGVYVCVCESIYIDAHGRKETGSVKGNH